MLDESARFCPICMTALITKTKIYSYKARRINRSYALRFLCGIALLAVILLAGMLWPKNPEATLPYPSAEGEVLPQQTDEISGIFTTETESDRSHTDRTADREESTDRTTNAPTDETDRTTKVPTESTEAATDSGNAEILSTSDPNTDTDTGTNTDRDTGTDTESTPSTETDEIPTEFPASGTYRANGVTWTFRVPTKRSEYPPEGYTDLAMDEVVLLTGMLEPAEDGIYRIPNEIYGRAVVYASYQDKENALSFSSPEVLNDLKAIYFPESTKGFTGAYDLRRVTGSLEIYIAADAFYLPTSFLPENCDITFHFAKNCRYGDNKSLYNLIRTLNTETRTCIYEEWDGDEI